MLRKVKVEEGYLKGITAADPRITVFKGIPFAKPPVNELRWAPPQPAEKWKGEKECYKFSAVPFQAEALPEPPDEDLYGKEWCVDTELPMSEDCLYLNVWTPAKKSDEKLPVYFWIYGGAWQVGNASEMEFDGERIARRGIVVVTINYRVNVFGFNCHKEISQEYPEAPANFGLLDQQFALKWVYKNINAFGGNCNNITIGGQSAGGGSVLFHLANEESRKYFKRAVIESGVFLNPFREVFPHYTLEQAENIGKEFFDFCGVKNLDEARKLPVEKLWKKWDEWGGFDKSIKKWLPVYENKFIHGDIFEALKNENFDLPPILTGYTTDEFLDSPTPEKPETLQNMIKYGIEKMIEAESKSKKKFVNFVYKFDVPIPGWDNPGKFHSVDLWFFFETLAKCWRPFTGVHYDMARKMCNYLCNFIKTGNPNDNGIASGITKVAGVNYVPKNPESKKIYDESQEILPEWKPCSFEDPNCMNFTTDCTLGKLW